MMSLFTLSLVTALSLSVSSPTVELKDLELLLGNWRGELEYLDYGDEESRITLLMRAVFTAEAQQIRFEYFFEEPGGREAADAGTIAPVSGGTKLRLGDDVLEIVTMQVQPDKARFIFRSRGQDNGRNARFETTIEVDPGHLLVSKQVTLEAGGRTFVRNSYRLTRAGSQAQTEASDPDALLGEWTVDLRPTPNAAAYEVEFEVTSIEGRAFTGTFYGSEIEEGRINTDWGPLRFGFVTRDGSGVYYTAGVLKDGKLEGTTHSLGRDFLSYWTAKPSP